ncbi:DUF1028 domain-containing protein [Thioclava sp. GXIMD2076]|uniref:DUF1028 domain-containing protein n=1 Tax=Thioclava sp. GXIMD2076 TaxID=3131931 RepID=UPI0030CDD0FF
MTFAIVGRCDRTGQFGLAISSSSPAVAARCAFARAGVGAVTTQNVTNPALGPLMLEALAQGRPAVEAVQLAAASDPHAAYRQLLAIGAEGAGAVHSGDQALGIFGSATGAGCASGGNLLADAAVPQAMVDAFEASDAALGDRLIAAMEAALALGGEAGPVHSAGMLIVDAQAWPWAELRIDWLDEGCPVAAMKRAWAVYEPQARDYVTRALNPVAAPSYGVPGDE